ncbi:hypothetical protein [Legionella feeleii]|nr:hypothetical protein [Legionella feeleii]
MNCGDDNNKNVLSLVEIDPVITENCSEQYTKNTYQDYLPKLPQNTHIKVLHKKKKSSLAFNFFWEKWVEFTSKPVNKNKSFEIFSHIVRNEEDPLLTIILEALVKQMQEKELRQKLNLFIPQWPNPSSWLGEARWEDEVCLDEEFYKAEILRRNSGLSQNNQTVKQQREHYLDGQYKSRITRIQDEQSSPIVSREDAIRQFDEEFRRKRKS